jgi:PLP dependent protein
MDDVKISERYLSVHGRVQASASRSGRAVEDLTVLAVSKRQDDDAVAALAELGHRDFGENLVQAWSRRLERFPSLRWHLVGALQTNKAATIGKGHPALVHTIDRSTLVDSLARRWDLPTPLDVLLQINVDREPQKAGCLPEDVDALADHVAASHALRLRGVMCIPQPVPGGAPRAAFQRTRELSETLSDRVEGALILSMGMSGDFEAAIEEGSTLIRIGTALFGPRAA